jgi:hypothetical protein
VSEPVSEPVSVSVSVSAGAGASVEAASPVTPCVRAALAGTTTDQNGT